MMIDRTALAALQAALDLFPVVALLGPRQGGMGPQIFADGCESTEMSLGE